MSRITNRLDTYSFYCITFSALLMCISIIRAVMLLLGNNSIVPFRMSLLILIGITLLTFVLNWIVYRPHRERIDIH